MHPYLEEPDRKYYYCPAVNAIEPSVYNTNTDLLEMQGHEHLVNLIGSKCHDGLHAPVIDLDVPIEVLPSSQLGHYHLYINKKILWPNYVNILLALKTAGLVEQGFYDSAISQGTSAVRPPGIIKPGVKGPVSILKENALLRKENYKLRKKLEALENENNTQGDNGQ